MTRIFLTQNLVDKTVCPEDKRRVDFHDTKITGFMFTVLRSGPRTYFLRFRGKRGKTIQRKIGNAQHLSLHNARVLTLKYLSQIAMGDNPFELKESIKKVPVFNDFINESYIPYIKTYKKSWLTDVSLLKCHILPFLGNMYLDDISTKNIFQLISKSIKNYSPATVNRILILIRFIFNLSIKWRENGIVLNPTHGIPLFMSNNRKERYLTADEAKNLILQLETSENNLIKYIVPMLILTGARKSEVIHAKWEEFNMEFRLWRIPMSKSGKARHVPISDGLVQLLNTIPRSTGEGSEYLFTNPNTGLPFKSIYGAWDVARKKVGLEDLRMHDLRHSFASFLVNNGRSLYEVQKILGHSQIKTTERYAHLSHASLLAAANEITNAVPSLLSKVSPTPFFQSPLVQIIENSVQ